MPLLDGLKVIRSKIHGYGVIATRPFREGEILLYGDGILYREEDEFDDEYALIVPGEEDEDGNEGPNLYWDLACQSRWINHSCDPNTEVDTEWQGDDTALAWWTALRDIRPGEELSYDYAFSGHLAMPCNCGTSKCRGLIVDPDEIHLVPEHLKRHLKRPPRRARRTQRPAAE